VAPALPPERRYGLSGTGGAIGVPGGGGPMIDVSYPIDHPSVEQRVTSLRQEGRRLSRLQRDGSISEDECIGAINRILHEASPNVLITGGFPVRVRTIEDIWFFFDLNEPDR
jgi:hypothetical protein